MYGTITTLVTVLSIAAYTLLADPAAAQSSNSASIHVGCTADNNCSDDPSVVATWPLDRWAAVRRADKRIAEPKTPGRVPANNKQ